MKFITKYIKEGFFGNLGIDTPGDIRRIFDDISSLRTTLPYMYEIYNHDMVTKYGFMLKYYSYYIALKYDTCQIIIHNSKLKTDRNDIIINMLDFPELVKNLAKNKVTGFYILDRYTLDARSYYSQKRRYGSNVSIIEFRCEEEGVFRRKYYRIKYDRTKHIATEME